jgi:hypothetical protein
VITVKNDLRHEAMLIALLAPAQIHPRGNCLIFYQGKIFLGEFSPPE